MAGYGATCDAHHITAPAPDGNGLARAIEASMKMGNISPEVCRGDIVHLHVVDHCSDGGYHDLAKNLWWIFFVFARIF